MSMQRLSKAMTQIFQTHKSKCHHFFVATCEIWHPYLITYLLVLLYAVAAKSLQSCLTLCDPLDGSLPGSPVPCNLQARTLEWVAISFSNAWKWKVKRKSLKSCPNLSDPMDCSLPGSSIHGIFQARVLEWVRLSSPLAKQGGYKIICVCQNL